MGQILTAGSNERLGRQRGPGQRFGPGLNMGDGAKEPPPRDIEERFSINGYQWSLSEFLKQFEFRSQSWCISEIGSGHGLQVHSVDVAYFYLLLEGSLRIYGLSDKEINLKTGECAFVLSGKSHLLSFSSNPRRHTIPLLQAFGYVDTPPTMAIGSSPYGARVLCGRLRVRWPTGKRLQGLPDCLRLDADSVLPINRFVAAAAQGEGGAAMLTNLANLLFVTAFRNAPDCLALFSRTSELDPIDRALRYIELHPAHAWTVDTLAKKVGMSRSGFAARFVAKTGKTPMDVLIEGRMKLAAQLLETSDLKISEVCERVGYSSEAAFHHRFAIHYYISPGRFRREIRQSDE